MHLLRSCPMAHGCRGAFTRQMAVRRSKIGSGMRKRLKPPEAPMLHSWQTDGSVISWGNPEDGGDSSAIKDQLKNVQQIQATLGAFAAILQDGSVLTWGKAAEGGDSSEVQSLLRRVRRIHATYGAFAAILADGSVVTWGCREAGGDSSRVELKDVQQICATGRAFAAILEDASLVTWGDLDSGGHNAVRYRMKYL